MTISTRGSRSQYSDQHRQLQLPRSCTVRVNSQDVRIDSRRSQGNFVHVRLSPLKCILGPQWITSGYSGMLVTTPTRRDAYVGAQNPKPWTSFFAVTYVFMHNHVLCIFGARRPNPCRSCPFCSLAVTQTLPMASMTYCAGIGRAACRPRPTTSSVPYVLYQRGILEDRLNTLQFL